MQMQTLERLEEWMGIKDIQLVNHEDVIDICICTLSNCTLCNQPKQSLNKISTPLTRVLIYKQNHNSTQLLRPILPTSPQHH